MSQVQFLFPQDVFSSRLPDHAYLEEYEAAQRAGITCSLFSYSDLAEGKFNPRNSVKDLLRKPQKVVYRGWMLTPLEYVTLQRGVEAAGGEMLTSAVQYEQCHYLPGWYERCQDLTPATLILSEEDDLGKAMESVSWDAFFVKDFVKSLTTKRGSIAHSLGDVIDIVDLISDFRDGLDGGICLREVEDFDPETEQRFFVLNGNAFGSDGHVPEIVRDVASRIQCPFFSVDIVLNRSGEPRLIEVGDGQVSDSKEWSVESLIGIFRH
ncbi:ATP-grasp domain-containing protein [Pseudomonas syringae pv. actinidiae]|nr:ATP-grasp domain-containing protein [Pseudomonas syringae pv. actinidiae]